MGRSPPHVMAVKGRRETITWNCQAPRHWWRVGNGERGQQSPAQTIPLKKPCSTLRGFFTLPDAVRPGDAFTPRAPSAKGEHYPTPETLQRKPGSPERCFVTLLLACHVSRALSHDFPASAAGGRPGLPGPFESEGALSHDFTL